MGKYISITGATMKHLFAKRVILMSILMIGLIVYFTGCVHVTTNTALNPDFEGRTYKNIMILCKASDQETAKQQEMFIIGEFATKEFGHLKLEPMSNLNYQSTEMDEDKRRQRIDQFIENNNIDAVLVLSQGIFDYNSFVTGATTTWYGAKLNYESYSRVAMSMELFNAKTRESIWYSRGGAVTSSVLRTDAGLVNSFISESIGKLKVTGLLDNPKKEINANNVPEEKKQSIERIDDIPAPPKSILDNSAPAKK